MHHFRTRAVHAGQKPDPVSGAIATPVCQTTAFSYGTLEHGAAIFSGQAEGYRYSRFANPTVAALEAKVADLEGAEAATAFGSGTAAISSILLAVLKAGDELLFMGPLYGGTESLFRSFGERFGIRVVDAGERGLSESLSPATRLIWLETLTNPTLEVHDLAEIAARAQGVTTVVDNTFCTPWLIRPLEHGIDLVMHSMTKYMGGHGDSVGGVVAGSHDLIDPVRRVGLGQLGGCLAANEAFLFLRGLKTLPLRMAAQCEGAAQVAEFLAGHPAVARTYYPGLASHPGHGLARRMLQNGFGGMVSLALKDARRSAAGAVLDRLQLFTQAVSLGDVDSLACHPASTTHCFVSAQTRERYGIHEGLIRLSIGIEHPADLIADLENALSVLA